MLNYCSKCSRVFKENDNCPYCSEGHGVILKKNAPVNVIGTKVKGNLFKVSDEKVFLLVKTENKEKILKEYSIDKIRKIL
ncbi:MAG: hypothetical protein ACRDD2_11590 [Sarcina sp.]